MQKVFTSFEQLLFVALCGGSTLALHSLYPFSRLRLRIHLRVFRFNLRLLRCEGGLSRRFRLFLPLLLVEDRVLKYLLILAEDVLFFYIGSDQLLSELADEVLALEDGALQVEQVSLALEQLLLQDVVQHLHLHVLLNLLLDYSRYLSILALPQTT